MEEAAGTPEELEEGDARLVTALRLVLLSIYVADLLVVVDVLTHGGVRDRLARAWRSFDANFLEPARRREAERRAASHVVFEAIQIVEEAAG